MYRFEESYDGQKNEKKVSSCLLLIILMLLMPSFAEAQITFSPTILMLDDDNLVREIRLTNLSNVSQEVEIIKRFGTPFTNEDGEPGIKYVPQDTNSTFSLNPFLKVYPSKVIIPARTRQMIRVQVETPADLDEQVYWSRLGIRSRAIAEEIGDQAEQSDQKISYVIQQNMGVYYKKGSVHTGVTIDSVTHTMKGDTLKLIANVRQQGNSPYFGIASFRLKSQEGMLIANTERVISVFFEANIAATFILPEFREGKYVLDLQFETERADISEEDIIQADDQIFTTQIEVLR